jgi:hypothetical protein
MTHQQGRESLKLFLPPLVWSLLTSMWQDLHVKVEDEVLWLNMGVKNTPQF